MRFECFLGDSVSVLGVFFPVFLECRLGVLAYFFGWFLVMVYG